jgi:hypothetical protein
MGYWQKAEDLWLALPRCARQKACVIMGKTILVYDKPLKALESFVLNTDVEPKSAVLFFPQPNGVVEFSWKVYHGELVTIYLQPHELPKSSYTGMFEETVGVLRNIVYKLLS